MSTVRVPSPLHRMLRAYKDEVTPDLRAAAICTLSTLLASFVRRHRACLAVLAGANVALTVAVPSSQRPGTPPLHALPGQPWASGLLVRGPGQLGHLRAAPDGFVVPEGSRSRVRERDVLLIDDALTTGAHAQSAAAALRRAGARSVVIVVLGRLLRPEAGATAARYWCAATARPFEPDRCCLTPCKADPAGA